MLELPSVEIPENVTYQWLSDEFTKHILGARNPKFILVSEDFQEIRSFLDNPPIAIGDRNFFHGAELIVMRGMKGRVLFFFDEIQPSYRYEIVDFLSRNNVLT